MINRTILWAWHARFHERRTRFVRTPCGTHAPVFVVRLLILFCVGCSSKATVTGIVSYEGKPVGGGVVVFFDAEGTGPYEKGTIDGGGRFTVTNLTPGKKKVQAAAKRVYLPPSEATERLPPSKPDFPDDADGNGQVFEVRSGAQTINIALKKPLKR